MPIKNNVGNKPYCLSPCGGWLAFQMPAAAKFARVCAPIGTNKSCKDTNKAPYKSPTAVAHTAKAQFRPPLLCSQPNATPDAITPLLQSRLHSLIPIDYCGVTVL
jgi:hypothetical protein